MYKRILSTISPLGSFRRSVREFSSSSLQKNETSNKHDPLNYLLLIPPAMLVFYPIIAGIRDDRALENLIEYDRANRKKFDKPFQCLTEQDREKHKSLLNKIEK